MAASSRYNILLLVVFIDVDRFEDDRRQLGHQGEAHDRVARAVISSQEASQRHVAAPTVPIDYSGPNRRPSLRQTDKSPG